MRFDLPVNALVLSIDLHAFEVSTANTLQLAFRGLLLMLLCIIDSSITFDDWSCDSHPLYG